MLETGPWVIAVVVGWILFTVCPVAAAAASVLAWRRSNRVLTVLAGALLAVSLLAAALPQVAAPSAVTAVTAIAVLVVAVAGGSPVVRALLDRTAFDDQEGPHGGIVVDDAELLRGGEVIGLLERLAVAGAIVAGVPEALAVVIAIKGVGRFTELENGAVRERFIVGTLGSWIWAAAAAGVVLLVRS